ncbi:outer membrane lipoprotein carrier protein LolA [Alphaproteobacteria bacterium]|nr:outer membrane lipoprotein carrier protein LolA [Alphaproteobacteria bacterium]MDC1023180.1 outer membrane lipoprotein carrier protein LolA [Alphaproteobacteria bacterium]
MKLSKIVSFFLSYFILTTFIMIYAAKITNSAESKKQTKLQVESFFNNLKTLEADFIQVSPSGKVSNGKIFLDIPGKIRIDYNKPNSLLITCKGFWIVIQDRELKSTNNIPLSQTPFSILLDNDINFNNKKLIIDLKKSLGIITLKIKLSKNTQAGEILLEFSEKPFHLKKWIIRDIVGDETTVLIQNSKYNKKLPFTIFFPNNFNEPND